MEHLNELAGEIEYILIRDGRGKSGKVVFRVALNIFFGMRGKVGGFLTR
jgi:hypothetical protein